MAQFTLSVTVEYPESYLGFTNEYIRDSVYRAIEQWAKRKGVSIVISEDEEEKTAADNRSMSADQLNRAVLPVAEQCHNTLRNVSDIALRDNRHMSLIALTTGEIRRFLTWWHNVKPQA